MKKIDKLEKKILKELGKKRFLIYIFLLINIVFWSTPLMPYLNVYVGFPAAIFMIILSFLLLFNLSMGFVLIIVAILFFISLIYQLLNQPDRADVLGNFIYGIIFVKLIK